MASSKEMGKALHECLKEVASLLDHAHNVAQKQQNALVKNDAEDIALSSRAQEEVLRRIGESDQRAAKLAADLAKTAGLEDENVDSESVARAAGYPYTMLIMQEMEHISALAETVARENEICSTLLGNGLDIIATCLITLASDPGPSAYGRSAIFSEPQAVVLSLDRKA